MTEPNFNLQITITICNNFKNSSSFLARLKKRKAIDDEVYQRIRPIFASTPTLYGLPKIHKNDTPLRLILSSVGSYNHKRAKWLSEILTPLRHHSTTVKDTFDFLHRFHNNSINNKIMGSFDVRSLFTNIPVDFTINFYTGNNFYKWRKRF